MDLSSLLSPALVSAGVSALIAAGAAVLAERRRKRSERESFILQKRFELYRQYSGVLERIAASSRQTLATLVSAMPAHFLSAASGTPDLASLTTDLSALMGSVMEGHAESKRELDGLRLVCTDSTLTLIEQYGHTQDQLLALLIDVLAALKNAQPIEPLLARAGSLGGTANEQSRALLQAMRSELRVQGAAT